MENSTAKDASRELFYKFVSDSFSTKELKNCRAVVLLGKERREIPSLDTLGINRNKVTCIENEVSVYKELCLWNMRQDPADTIELYYYELTEYLHFLLNRKQSVEIFNLDIYGTLQNKVLPEFRNVIRLSNAQQKTVIGTYLTAGRDQHVLVHSFQPAVWLMLFDSKFIEFAENLTQRFITAGYSKRVAVHHTFRVLQWIYSILQTLLVESYPARTKAISLDKIPELFWEETVYSASQLTWKKLVSALNGKGFNSKLKDLTFECVPTKITFAAYRSNKWTQLCQFMRMEKGEVVTFDTIVDRIIKDALRIHYAKTADTKLELIPEPNKMVNLSRVEILDKNIKRKLGVILRRTSREKVKKPIEKTEELIVASSPAAANILAKPNSKHRLWTQRKKFTKQGRQLIKELAGQGLKTVQVASYFPKKTPFLSIAALIALANRAPRKTV